MTWWDKKVKTLIIEIGYKIYMYKRYVDDINVILSKENEDEVEISNNNIELGDMKIMNDVKSIGNRIHQSIKLEIDYPSAHEDKKLPILDVKVWLVNEGGRQKIMHEYYCKEVRTKALINARSALSWKMKMNILVNQAVKIMTNTNRALPWETTCIHLNRMMLKIQYSGYNKKTRYEILQSALAT